MLENCLLNVWEIPSLTYVGIGARTPYFFPLNQYKDISDESMVKENKGQMKKMVLHILIEFVDIIFINSR